jgi:hypothetical protein
MIWLTWRQFRTQAVVAAAALAAFAVLLAATGPHLASLYDASGITGCHGDAGDSCVGAADHFLMQLQIAGTYAALYLIGVGIILLAPAVVGLFWGAPLIARELETGTSALAWNQSVTRTRWLAVKLALTGLGAMAVTEALSLMQVWWAAPIDRAVDYGGGGGPFQGRYSLLVFATHGITPIGYAAFAFTLGVTAGALIRRTIPAMAVTLAIFAAAQVAMPLGIRPNLFPADRTVVPVTSLQGVAFGPSGANGTGFVLAALDVPGQSGTWILSSGPVNAAGQTDSTTPAACAPLLSENGPNFISCLGSHGVREEITYQPASRYWPMQWIETAIYLALSLALAGYCFWRLERRVS